MLVRRATALAARGRLADAGRLYDQAATLHRRARRGFDEATCLTLVAQCRRLTGDLPGATRALDRAAALGTARTAIDAERAECAISAGDLETASNALTDALASAAPAAAPELLRRRATTFAGLGKAAHARRDFADAADSFAAAGEDAKVRRVLVEWATAMHTLGDTEELAAALARARAAVSGDPALSGELDLLEAAEAVRGEHWERAEELTLSARERALASRSPTLYCGASISLAELAGLRGDRLAAYRALATGWATLGDLLGSEAAATVFRPKLEALQRTWGTEAFATVRREHEHLRRTELGRN